MKIYTKTGDKGNTGTFYGRINKGDQLTEALGAVDELNSWIGLCRVRISKLETELRRVQTNLLIIGSGLAGSPSSKLRKSLSLETRRLEKLIDKLTDELPKLSNFIYPVGELQVARGVCRRAEREVVALGTKDKKISRYLNRLSDALFVMGRWVNHKLKIPEEVWRG